MLLPGTAVAKGTKEPDRFRCTSESHSAKLRGGLGVGGVRNGVAWRARRLRRVVAAKLRQDWSPEQIAHWLVTTYPDDPTMHVSHESIYRTPYVQARGALKQELAAHLRRRGVVRHSRARTARPEHRGQIPEAVSIAEHPPTAESGARATSCSCGCRARMPRLARARQPRSTNLTP